MRDGLLFGMALFLILGGILFWYDASLIYTDVCHGILNNRDPTKPLLCDPVTFYFTLGMGSTFATMGTFLMVAWWSGHLPEAS